MEHWMPLGITALVVMTSLVFTVVALRRIRRGRSRSSDLVSVALGGAAAVDSVPPTPLEPTNRSEDRVSP